MLDPLIDPASRAADVRAVYSHVRFGEPCAVVGLNDIGKTTLLTLLADPEVARRVAPVELGHDFVPVLVDCNLLGGASERDLYAVMAQVAAQALRRAGHASAAQAALAFVQGQAGAGALHGGPAAPAFTLPESGVLAAVEIESLLVTLVEEHSLTLCFLFDEFDAVYRDREPRVALALRAFRNRLGPRLCYVLALDRPLGQLRGPAGDTAEFEELFAGGILTLGTLPLSDAEAFVLRYVKSRQVTAPEWLASRLAVATGGHAGLLWACCAATVHAPLSSTEHAVQELSARHEVVGECQNIWLRLTPAEREAVMALRGRHDADPVLVAGLRERGFLSPGDQHGTSTPAIPLLAAYLDHISPLTSLNAVSGLALDAATGEVKVNGVRITAQLGPTEFRLLQELKRRSGALVTKEEIARAVWPEERHLDGVNDARIDKLMDRLRSKIEPDPKTPRFLITVRGLGYRLLSAA